MKGHASYRLRMAEGFLKEAEADFQARRWRACVSHAQLAVEHALKAIIACFTLPPKTHNPAQVLMTLLRQGQIPIHWEQEVENLASLGQNLGPEVHIRTDYGDEPFELTPWELFDEEDAQEALAIAREVIARTRALIQATGGTNET